MTEEAIVALALEKPEPARAAFLAEACGGDAALRRRAGALRRPREQAGAARARPAATAELRPGGQGVAARMAAEGVVEERAAARRPGPAVSGLTEALGGARRDVT